MTKSRFQEHVVLVTGTASGIGRATAKRFAADCAAVGCLDINGDGVRATTKSITDNGGKAIALECDVRDQVQVKKAVTEVIDTYGKLTILCNVAGVLAVSHVVDETAESWDRVLSTNVTGPFYLSQAAIPELLKHRGNIVNVASTAGLAGHAYMTAYCASKHAIIGLTRSMAVEFSRRGVRVNAVCPGGTNTAIAEGIQFPAGLDNELMARLQLSPAVAEPEDMANVICFVASDEAAYMNGSIVSADSGAVAV